MTYTLYGAPVSLYTRKARSYLRAQGIDFVEHAPGSDRYLFELFGGEGLLRPAMHYRWNFDEQNLAFLNSEFALLVPGQSHDEQAFVHNGGRMRKAAVNFGLGAVVMKVKILGTALSLSRLAGCRRNQPRQES